MKRMSLFYPVKNFYLGYRARDMTNILFLQQSINRGRQYVHIRDFCSIFIIKINGLSLHYTMVYITKQPTLNNGLFIHFNVIKKINILPYTMAYITKHPTLHNGLLKSILHYTMAYYKTSYITQWPLDTL